MEGLPVNTISGFIGLALLLVGLFFLLTGFEILKVEKISVKPGKPTWIIGIVLAIIGVILIWPESRGQNLEIESVPQTQAIAEDTSSNTEVDNATPTEVPVVNQKEFIDDFSDPASGWLVLKDNVAERYYADGEFFIHQFGSSPPDSAESDFSHQTGEYQNAWSVIDIETQPGLIIEVDVRLEQGEVDNANYGILFNYENSQNFLYFEINLAGYWDFVQCVNGQYRDIIEWQYSEAVATGNAVNRIRIEFSDTANFYINGTNVGSARIDSYQGSIGLFTTNWSGNELIYAFDNFKYWK